MAPQFKRLLVAFWAVFFTVTAVTNLVDLLGALGALDWRFLRSGNYDYLRSVVDVYGVGPALTEVLLAGCARSRRRRGVAFLARAATAP